MDQKPSVKKRNASYESTRRSGRYPIGIHIFSENVEKARIVPRHWHPSIEITYRIRYKGCLTINNTKYTDLNNTVYVINSCDIHEIQTYPQKDMYSILVILPYNFLLEFVPEIDYLRFRIDPYDTKIQQLILEIGMEYEKNDRYSHIKVHSLVFQLVYELLEHAIVDRQVQVLNHKSMQWEMDVIDYSEQHIKDIVSMEQVAEVFGYSREAFSRKFKNLTGSSYYQFLLLLRLQSAAELLIFSRKDIESIRLECGFSSLRAFRENFKKHYHQSPEAYRKNR